MTADDLGRLAYRTWCESMSATPPPWEGLPDEMKAAWRRSGVAGAGVSHPEVGVLGEIARELRLLRQAAERRSR